jgi:hypothetical protein
VALAASAWKSGEFDRGRVPAVTGGAIADGSIFIGSADAMATRATTFSCGRTFERSQRVGWPLYAAWLILFRKGYLLRCETLLAPDCCPRGGCMSAPKELLVYGIMTSAAISRSDGSIDHKSIVICSFLSLCHLMTIEAINTFLRMSAHLELMDYGIL